MTWRTRLALWLAPELEAAADQRVADVLLHMDPFEPFLKKHKVVFSEEWERAEDRLSEESQIQLYQWAYGLESDANWKHLTAWVVNTQGNATLREGRNEFQWFYGRASIVTIELMIQEIRRLSSKYQELMEQRGHSFDPHITSE